MVTKAREKVARNLGDFDFPFMALAFAPGFSDYQL